MLPPFTDEGLLPPGDYNIGLAELRDSMLVRGPVPASRYPQWDTNWRARLVDNLGILVGQLRRVGINEVFVDGSFVEDKDHPNDIDGYFECQIEAVATGRLQRELNALDPYRVWTWEPSSRRPYFDSSRRYLPMWHRYRVELYPHFGQLCGIRDPYGHELEFPSAFRLSRQGRPRGIIRIGEPS